MALIAVLDDRFVPCVTRGRRSYGHPTQLGAMVKAGLTSADSACWAGQPRVIPGPVEMRLLHATPAEALAAVESLDWHDSPAYYMFERRIGSWSKAEEGDRDLRLFGTRAGV